MVESNLGPTRGIRLLVEALRAEDFPMDKQAINYCVGDIEIDDGAGGYVPVRHLTDRLEQGEFRSAEEVVSALRNALKAKKTAA